MTSEYTEEHETRYCNEKPLEVAYIEGFKSGQNWDAPWVPAGPYVCKPLLVDKDRDPELYAHCKHTENYNKEWRRGWHDGFQNK